MESADESSNLEGKKIALLSCLGCPFGHCCRDDAAMKAKVEGWQKPIEQVAESLEKVVRNIDRRWQEQTWQHHLAFGLGGMATGALLTLCVFLH